MRRLGLDYLPVELLYEIQLYALSPSLPHVSKHLHQVYRSAPSSYNAQYILGIIGPTESPVSRILRYPLCTKPVLDALARIVPRYMREPFPELPRRLFKALSTKQKGSRWTERDYPLPFLKYLYEEANISHLDSNAHEGYALTRAVHARFLPLVRFLLEHGASPQYKKGLAVMVAIRQKDLGLVRMLVEREGPGKEKGKKRRLEDRVKVTPEMLRIAVKCDARDVAEYLTKEKGCVPDLATLNMTLR